jgi:hypothetical protein
MVKQKNNRDSIQRVESFPDSKRPHEIDVQKRHFSRLPLSPMGHQMPSPARLKLVTPATIPAYGYPITCGIPMPPGVLKNEKSVKLYDNNGIEIPVQTKTIGLWQDGSIRWLLLNSIAPADSTDGAEFQLHFNDGAGITPKTPVKIEQNEQITISNGAIEIKLGADPQILVDSVSINKHQPVMTIKPRMSILMNGVETLVNATWQNIEIKDNGQLAICIEINGSLDTKENHIGRFLFRLYAYAGLPTLQSQFRIFNDVKPENYTGVMDDLPLNVTDLSLVADIPDGIRGKTTMGTVGSDPLTSETGIISVIQEDAERFTSSNGVDGKRIQGWVDISGANGHILASMWRFWQQYPKSLKVNKDNLEIGLFTPVKDVPLYKPRFGETKRHDIWFTFTDEPMSNEAQSALGMLADQPPRLFDSQWFCISGGINLLDPNFYQNDPKLKKYTLDNYGDVSSQRITGQFGIRNFGDMPYGSAGQWRNGYWAMVQGSLNWGLASGDQRWLERSFEIARHISDVDSVHIPNGHPDWDQWHGVICAIGNDHSVHGGNALWPAFQVGESLILHYWMTGDPDSLDSAVANADFIIRNQAGVGSVEARSQARPMLTLLRVWQATGNQKYLQSATRYLDLKYQIQNVIDWRRGAYIQPTYENWRCISAGLDSMYALNIYEYYRLTGDLDAAQLVVAIADSVYAESMLPQEEGIGSFIFYVRYSRGSWYYTQMAMLFHSAYDLTSDIRFLRAGRAGYERYRLCQNANGDPMYQSYDNFGWLDPEFGGWQLEFKNVFTEPFNINGQTPIPDPSGY